MGSYVDAASVSHGFTLKGTTYTAVDFPGALFTVLAGLNPSGEMVGFYSTRAQTRSAMAEPPEHVTVSKCPSGAFSRASTHRERPAAKPAR